MLLQRVVAAVFLICELIVPAALFTISYKALKEKGKALAVATGAALFVVSLLIENYLMIKHQWFAANTLNIVEILLGIH